MSDKCSLLLVIMFISLCVVHAQAQDIVENTGSAVEDSKPLIIPARASMLSASLPGLGQVYNRKYWKIPIIYAGFGAVAYYLGANNNEYQRFRAAYVARVDGNPNTTDEFPFHSTDVLQRAMNFYRRNLEVTYLLGIALYLLNILDANVDAHLRDFDVGESLSLVMETVTGPVNNNIPARTGVPGLTLKFRF